MLKLRKNRLTIVLFMLSVCCALVGLASCKKDNENKNKIKEGLVQWATQTNETVEYYDYYFAPMDIVAVEGKEFLPAVKVQDSKGTDVALVSDKFLIEDMGGYVVKFIVGYNGAAYEKTINLNIVIANPNIFVGEVGDCYVGIDCLVPAVAVMENDGEKINYTTQILNAQNQELEIVDGKFKATAAGEHFLTISAKGKNGQEVIRKEAFTVKEIPIAKDVLLKNTEINSDWYTTPDGSMPEGFTVYGYKGIKSTGKNLTVALDIGMSLELLREKFVSLAVVVTYQGDGQNNVNVKLSPDGEPIRVYSSMANQTSPSFIHWQYYTITVPTAEFDGNLYFVSTAADDTEYTFSFVSATAVCDGLFVSDYEQEQTINVEFAIPTVKYVLNHVEQTDADIAISATFEDEPVPVQDRYTFAEEGEFVVTYTYKALVETVKFRISRGKMLATSSNIISKTTVTAGKATLGNVSGAQYPAYAASCIKLPADPDWSTNTVTLSIEVGDVSGYDHLEMTFWALGIQGDTWFLYVNDVEAFTAVGWRGWEAPVTITIPVSAVRNGRLSITFTQTWQTGDELYIQTIQAIK